MGQSSTRCKHFDHWYLNKQKHLSLTVRCWGVQRLDWGLSYPPPIMKTECTSEQTQCKTKQRLHSFVFFDPVMLNVVVDEICAGTLIINPMLITVSVKLSKQKVLFRKVFAQCCMHYTVSLSFVEFWETTGISVTFKKMPLKEPQVQLFCK